MSGRQFKVIPVIDVRHHQAVRAQGGDRSNYLPLETPLAPGTSDPVEIARAYRRLFPFDTVYVADLDGIEGRGSDRATQARVANAWGRGEVWVDDGLGKPGVERIAQASSIVKVQGSESLSDASSRLTSGDGRSAAQPDAGLGTGRRRDDGKAGAPDNAPSILSLDFRRDTFLGPPALLASPDLWPRRVIVMTLARVGAAQGPDLDRLGEILRCAGPGRLIYAAGGVRNLNDLHLLRHAGCAGALVATALHCGQIKTGDLEEIAGERC